MEFWRRFRAFPEKIGRKCENAGKPRQIQEIHWTIHQYRMSDQEDYVELVKKAKLGDRECLDVLAVS